ncbi:MAG: aminotransferase class I/II-fold pyridoxal phosphate-dependent enzyme [Pseudohongiella sp.]|nr:aminotransferase class I/II-fold pyridoxal phosphate-dependent enzyme [Pseudohongiella sp.]
MEIFEDLVIESNRSIRETMVVVDQNGRGICFVLDNGILVGIATDGDLRRALLRGLTLDNPVSDAMNRNFTALPVTSEDKLIRQTFSTRLKIIPLTDESGKLVDIADVQRSHRIPVLEPQLAGRELEYVTDCILTNWISSQGSYVQKFEFMFEKMHPEMHAVCVSNGTVALHLALLALGIGEGDEVIVPDLTFAASINAVLYCKATPVLCEIDPNTWCIDVLEIKKLITSRTKAVMPVHLYGQICEMEALRQVCEESKLFLIEDCAEALGSSWNKKIAGTFGDSSTFSFFGNKTISTGEGGMVLFRDPEAAKQARILRDHGMSPGKRYWHECIGFNYRLTNLQAAIGVAQMERFPEILSKKLEIAERYNALLAGVPGISRLPFTQPNTVHSNWLYTVTLVPNISRDELMRRLLMHGIDTRPVFYPLHEMPPYVNFKRSDKLLNSKEISICGLSLPSSVTLQAEEISYIATSLVQELSNC